MSKPNWDEVGPELLAALTFAAHSLAGIASVNMQNTDYRAKLKELAEWRLDAMLSLKSARAALAKAGAPK